MTAKVGQIKACVFDAYGTLFDVHAPAARLEKQLGRSLQAISATWRAKQLEYSWLRTLMGRHANFWQITREALDYALDQEGQSDDGELRRELLRLYERLDAYAEVPDVLTRLSAAGRRTAILSNGSPDMLASAVEAAGIEDHLDAVLSIEEVGLYKPAPASYRLACERLDVRPDEICFISSNGFDVAGSAAFGFKTVWVNRFKRPAERLPAGPLATLHDLSELPDLVI